MERIEIDVRPRTSTKERVEETGTSILPAKANPLPKTTHLDSEEEKDGWVMISRAGTRKPISSIPETVSDKGNEQQPTPTLEPQPVINWLQEKAFKIKSFFG